MDILGGTLVTCGVGALALGAARRRRHRRAWVRRLARGDVELPLDRAPLPELGRLTVQARTLRLQLQTPVTRYFAAPWPATPWGRRQICDEYDLAVVDARRALWEWIRDVKRLPSADLGLLRKLGIDLQAVGLVYARSDLFDRTDNPWDAVLWPRGPDVRRVADELALAVEALGRFEVTLLVARANPYR